MGRHSVTYHLTWVTGMVLAQSVRCSHLVGFGRSEVERWQF